MDCNEEREIRGMVCDLVQSLPENDVAIKSRKGATAGIGRRHRKNIVLAGAGCQVAGVPQKRCAPAVSGRHHHPRRRSSSAL